MKTLKTRIAAALFVLLMLLPMTGCGNQDTTPDYPVMELVDYSGLDLIVAEDDAIQYEVDQDKWIPGTNDAGTMLALYAETEGTDNQISVTANVAGYFGETLDQNFADEITAGLDNEPTLTLQLGEMRTLGGEPILYTEVLSQYTEESIDGMLESGQFTEEGLAAAGGREALLQVRVEMVMIYKVVDEELVIYCGSFSDESQKQDVLDALNVMIQTTELK